MECVEHIVEIPRPHVLGGVDTEPRHTPVYESIQVVDDLPSHPRSITLQVSQTHQPTVANLDRVVVILDHITRNDLIAFRSQTFQRR